MKVEKILELLDNNDLRLLHSELIKINAVDLAETLADLNNENLAIVFRLLEKEQAAAVFSYMDTKERNRLLKVFNNSEIVRIFNSLYADDAVDFLSDMPSNVVTHLLDNIDDDVRKDINSLLQYSDDSVGSIMTVEFVEFTEDMSVQSALDKIRRVGIDSETVYTCYVVDHRKCIGIVTAKDLILSDPLVKIKDIMKSHFIYALTGDDKEDTAKKLRKYGLISLPVLDPEGCIVGIVTFDDAIDVLTDETTEDMQKMAAMSANDKPYLETSIWQHARNRIVWLLFLMLSATITGNIIARYEYAFSMIPLLVSFIPMLMDTGGNCGSQSSTLIIRGLAVDELKFNDIFKIMWKEFRISLIVGAVLALANGLRIYIMNNDLYLAAVVSLSLIGTVVIAKMVGCVLPIFARKIKLDPAIMAAPLITTIVDTLSIIIYFNIASRIFQL